MTPIKTIFLLILCSGLAACAPQTAPEDARMADMLSAQGKTLLAAGKYTEARDIYLSATSRNDSDVRAWNGLGVAYDLLGKRDKAKDAYRHAVDAAPQDMMAANNLAHLYLEEGDPASAVQLLTPFAGDETAPAALKQNLAEAVKKAQIQKSLSDDVYADLGSYPTRGDAKRHGTEAKALLGGDETLSFLVVPEVKVGGGTKVYTVRVVGKTPQSICDDLNPQGMPCIPHGE